MVQWHDNGRPGLCFDDVLIRPAFSTLSSRLEADTLSYNLFSESGCQPIIVANMIDVATVPMARRLAGLGIQVPMHRYQAADDEAQQLCSLAPDYHEINLKVCGTVGLADRGRTHKVAAHADVLFLELAHADNQRVIEEIKYIRQQFPQAMLVVGNVATADATKRLLDAGAHIIKVGVGPGAVCTTRIITGCGVPQLSAIMECAPCGPIIADGGIRASGDILKALAAGAKAVMIGSLFAGTDEARVGGVYSGMASFEAGKVREGTVPEGVSVTVPYRGSATKVASDLIAGLRQGMSMIGAATISQIPDHAIFQMVTPATTIENQPHIKLRF